MIKGKDRPVLRGGLCGGWGEILNPLEDSDVRFWGCQEDEEEGALHQ